MSEPNASERERIHPWECPDCGSTEAPYLRESLAVWECYDCGYTVAIDEVGP